VSRPFEFDKPHRRRNLLTGEWVLVSPQRTQRPWQGHEDTGAATPPQYDDKCYLCPGNARAGDVVNPVYEDVFVFDNDFPALLAEEASTPNTGEMFSTEPVRGRCRVICYGPRHDLALHRMDLAAIRRVIEAWIEESEVLSADHEWVQIFENRGSLMGASNPHPHGQIWAIDTLPTEPAKEADHQSKYFEKTGRRLLLDYLAAENAAGERLVYENQDWVALVPYWAIWPFESIIIPRRGVARLQEITGPEQRSLADLLKALFNKYDRLFEAPMSYSMGWHSAPSSDSVSDSWQLHAHIYPPALRSATIPKFMVGFELLGEKQRDITAESAAARLRELPAD
jgi:UDPglucose--hexose-1-phosphate uridylyltransferase